MWLSDTVADEIEEDEEEKWLKKRRSRLASVPGYLFLVFAKQTNINTSKFLDFLSQQHQLRRISISSPIFLR